MGVADPISNLQSFRSCGETGYVHREQRQKGAKFDGRPVPMHDVGREGSWIYLMWDPQTRKVNRSSSVAWASHQIAEMPRTQPVQQADDYYRPQPLSIPVPAADFTSAPPPPPAEQTQPSLIQPPPTPPLVREPGGDASGGDAGAHNLEQGSGFDFHGLNPHSHEAPRHLDISAPIDERNSITGTRSRYLAVAKVTAKLARCLPLPSSTSRRPPLCPLVSQQLQDFHRSLSHTSSHSIIRSRMAGSKLRVWRTKLMRITALGQSLQRRPQDPSHSPLSGYTNTSSLTTANLSASKLASSCVAIAKILITGARHTQLLHPLQLSRSSLH
jgi:hypothetical protein